MDMVMSWVKSGLLFAILASVIMLLGPDKSYMKYISLVVGLIFILVMIHPVMDFLNLDSTTYISYIEKLLMLKSTEEEMSDRDIAMYEESVALQLTATLNDNGYQVKEIEVEASEDSSICEVQISFEVQIDQLEQIDHYIHQLFGEEVKVIYAFG